uniref:Disease resistance N-terminal domain-containing protein n=1 Tax=Nelumbo nucifera TaxID=4432 RepID=A0A822YF73_NELNU|nr:TPA_asm: hypothetical protein HUJ06_031134 [Nelumbo nucifera]
MVEALVRFCLNKVDSLLREQVKQPKGVKEDIRELRNELDSIRAFLKEADSRKESDKGVKAWMEQVRDVAFDIEDILDEFVLEVK